MITKAQLKALEQSAYEGEKKRLQIEKNAKKQARTSARDKKLAEDAVLKGIAKAHGKPYVSEETKTKAKKVGGWFERMAKQAIENIADDSEYEEMKAKRSAAAKKAAATRKRNAGKKTTSNKRKTPTKKR